MRYKTGDKVRIKSLDWYNTNKNDFGLIFCNHICFDEKMTEFCGKTVTIAAQRNEKYYFIMEDNCLSFWSEDMIEGIADVEPQEKMISLDKACEVLKNIIVDDVFTNRGSVIKYMSANEFIEYFRKATEE